MRTSTFTDTVLEGLKKSLRSLELNYSTKLYHDCSDYLLYLKHNMSPQADDFYWKLEDFQLKKLSLIWREPQDYMPEMCCLLGFMRIKTSSIESLSLRVKHCEYRCVNIDPSNTSNNYNSQDIELICNFLDACTNLKHLNLTAIIWNCMSDVSQNLLIANLKKKTFTSLTLYLGRIECSLKCRSVSLAKSSDHVDYFIKSNFESYFSQYQFSKIKENLKVMIVRKHSQQSNLKWLQDFADRSVNFVTIQVWGYHHKDDVYFDIIPDPVLILSVMKSPPQMDAHINADKSIVSSPFVDYFTLPCHMQAVKTLQQRVICSSFGELVFRTDLPDLLNLALTCKLLCNLLLPPLNAASDAAASDTTISLEEADVSLLKQFNFITSIIAFVQKLFEPPQLSEPPLEKSAISLTEILQNREVSNDVIQLLSCPHSPGIGLNTLNFEVDKRKIVFG